MASEQGIPAGRCVNWRKPDRKCREGSRRADAVLLSWLSPDVKDGKKTSAGEPREGGREMKKAALISP